MVLHLVLWIAIGVLLLPIFWVVVASLHAFGNLYGGGGSQPLTMVNYTKLLRESPFLLWVRNSCVVCGAASILSLMLTTTAGYAFARLRFAGRKVGLLALIVLQMFPAMMAMWALYGMLCRLSQLTAGAVGFNLAGLILIYAGGGVPFNTWMIKGYLDSVPRELEESASIDGATPWQTFRLIILPLLGPVLVVVGILTFIGAYNDFLIPSIVLQDESSYTLAVGLRSFISGRYDTSWTAFAAASVMGAIPVLGLFLSVQRFLVEGLTKGALKG
jgi:ABC-type maltose transport system permease subunit